MVTGQYRDPGFVQTAAKFSPDCLLTRRWRNKQQQGRLNVSREPLELRHRLVGG